MLPLWAWALALVVLFGLYLRSVAGRLDRLHVRLEAAADALDASLVRRSAIANEVALSGLVDPASGVLLADAAHAASEVVPDDWPGRERAESALSSSLRAVLVAEEVDELKANVNGLHLLGEVRSASDRVILARQFHNESARATLRLRRRRLVRWFRLAGTAPWPRSFEIDDAPPPRLS